MGWVALDIKYTYPEDSGVYICKATNKYGEDTTQADIRCRGRKSVIYDSQLPEGSTSVERIQAMEQAWTQDTTTLIPEAPQVLFNIQ